MEHITDTPTLKAPAERFTGDVYLDMIEAPARGRALARRGHRPAVRRLHGGPAPVRRFLPEPIDLIYDRAFAAPAARIGHAVDRTMRGGRSFPAIFNL